MTFDETDFAKRVPKKILDRTKENMEDAWYTPAFFSDVWIERRRWQYLDQFIKLRSNLRGE